MEAMVLRVMDGRQEQAAALQPRYHARHVPGVRPLVDLVGEQDGRAERQQPHVLRERCEHLGRYLAITSDSAHADLTYEQNYSEATADIADEFCADLDDLAPCTAPSHAGVTRDATRTSAGQTQQKPMGNPEENQRVHTQLALEA